VPSQRAAGQSLIGCHIDNDFAAEIDAARGSKSRSDFLREAIWKYLESTGKRLPPQYKHAPDRAGKGGRPRKIAVTPSSMMNEEPGEVARQMQASAKASAQTVYPKGNRAKK
jgi:hypothetical protein